MIEVRHLHKQYAGGFTALKDIHLSIRPSEIFALLGPNGAGKTTLISTICGIVTPTSGEVFVNGHDIQKAAKKARSLIGLVPQELTTDAFETVWNTVSFSRGLFGKKKNPNLIASILKDLSLWDKRNNRLMSLSGGMKRRVLIAKALSHEPKVLFLDEPTAGVDVELRKSMWEQVHKLRESGVTIILTTHYIEEAEEMADRVGVISKGEIILVEDKKTLMKKLGCKELTFDLQTPLAAIPEPLKEFQLELSSDQQKLTYRYDSQGSNHNIPRLLMGLEQQKIAYKDLYTHQSSLEEIFVGLLKNSRGPA